MSEHIRHTGLDPVDAMTNSNPVTACLARIAGSTMTEEMHKLLNAEVNRGTDIAALATAFALFSVQTHASVLAQLVGEKPCNTMAEMYEAIVRLEYVRHAQRTREGMLAEGTA